MAAARQFCPKNNMCENTTCQPMDMQNSRRVLNNSVITMFDKWMSYIQLIKCQSFEYLCHPFKKNITFSLARWLYPNDFIFLLIMKLNTMRPCPITTLVSLKRNVALQYKISWNLFSYPQCPIHSVSIVLWNDLLPNAVVLRPLLTWITQNDVLTLKVMILAPC